MNARFDSAVWSGVERRLADVEAFIPDAPPWMRSDSVVPRGVRAGTTFRRSGERPFSRRRRLVLVLTVIAVLLAIAAAAILVGTPRNDVDRLEQPFGPFGIYRPSDPGGSAAVLPDGRVLIASGSWTSMGENVRAEFDIWDPVNGRVSTGTMGAARIDSAATLLLDGRVLVTGGFGGPYAYSSSAIASAELWDPTSQGFTATGSMAAARVGHTATLLPDGRVLVIGGTGPGGSPTFAELWDPATGVFRQAGDLAGSVDPHTATLLPSGDVLALGDGQAEIWRLATERFTEGPRGLSSMGGSTATPLLDGRFLVIQADAFARPQTPPAAFIVSEAAAPTSAGTLLHSRARYATTLLPDGRVLITGGVESEQGPATTSVEIFDPADGSFRDAAPLAQPVDDHMALLLPDGRVLIVFNVSGPEGQTEPFLYDPAPRTTG